MATLYQMTWTKSARNAAIALGAAVILPLIFHILPTYNNLPSGAIYLPIFIAPLLAVLFDAPLAAVLTALFAPIINHLLTGMPAAPMVTILTAELLAFTAVAMVICQRFPNVLLLSIPALLAAKVATFVVMVVLQPLPAPPLTFVTNSIINGLPGIVLLVLIPFAVKRFMQK